MPSLHIRRRDAQGAPILWGVSLYGSDKKQHWKHFRTEEAAQSYLAQENLAHASRRAINRTEGKVALSVIFEGWIRSLELGKRRPRTIEAYRWDWKTIWESSNIKYAEQLTNPAVNDLLKGKYSNQTLRRQISVLRSVLEFAKWSFGVEVPGIHWKDLFRRIENKNGASTKKFLTDKEFLKICEAIEKGGDQVAAIMARLSGCYGFRIGEICSLEVADIDDHNRINLPGIKTKSGQPRRVPIDDELGKQVWRLRKQALAKRAGKTDTNRMFLDLRSGEPVSVEMLRARYNAACIAVGLDHKALPYHRLRSHAFGYLYEMLDHDLESVKQVCGWQSLAYQAYVADRTDRLYDIKGKTTLFLEGQGNEKLPSKTLRQFQEAIKEYDTAALVEMTKGIATPTWITYMRSRNYLDALPRMEAVLEAIGKRLVIIDAPDKKLAKKK